MSARLRLELLGGCRLTDRRTGQAVEFRTRKARCLLGLVALWPGASMSREKLASFLWDPAPEEQARASLRQCLKEVREVLGDHADHVLAADRLTVGIAPGSLEVDALDLLNRVPAARTDQASALDIAQLWKGEPFGDAVPAAPVFEAWVQVERSRIRTIVSTLLTDHLERLIQIKDFSHPEIADELVRIEPSHELAHQFLMRFHALRGDQAGALRQFARLDKILAEELDSEPSKESVDLLVAIKRGDVTPEKEVAPSPIARLAEEKAARRGPPKIAVRPPLTRFEDETKDYLAEGFANLTRVCLSKFRCWIILSWPSTGFESKVHVDFEALGSAIGADYVIDSVLDWRQQQGRLFVSLVDCRDSSQVWSDVLSINEPELQSIGSSVAGIVASKLASQINHIALLRYARSAPGNAAAYDMWLRGHQLSRLWSTEADTQAKELFTQAIELDHGLACAYASLASVLNTQGMIRPGYAGEKNDMERAFELSQTAVSLDPFDSRNHFNMAWSWLLANSAERAHSHFKLAVDLNPYDSETLIASAMGMAFLGQLDLAKEWSDTAVRLNPLHPEYFLGYLAAIRYLSGDFSGTLDVVARCQDIFPETRAWAAAAHVRLGQEAEARKAFEGFLAAVRGRWEGASPPHWDDIHIWLYQALPIVWPEGKQALDQALIAAHALAKAQPIGTSA
jgi:DNA-binding SARP family transcriptional activator/Tfp pilus assembly protein PilF